MDLQASLFSQSQLCPSPRSDTCWFSIPSSTRWSSNWPVWETNTTSFWWSSSKSQPSNLWKQTFRKWSNRLTTSKPGWAGSFRMPTKCLMTKNKTSRLCRHKRQDTRNNVFKSYKPWIRPQRKSRSSKRKTADLLSKFNPRNSGKRVCKNRTRDSDSCSKICKAKKKSKLKSSKPNWSNSNSTLNRKLYRKTSLQHHRKRFKTLFISKSMTWMMSLRK